MSMVKRILTVLIVTVLMAGWTMPAAAADTSLKTVLEDSVYGGLIGSLLGAASIAFMNNKSDHLDHIVYGGAFGIFAGAGYGVFKSTVRPFAEYENGKVNFAIPTVLPEIQEKGKGQMVLSVKADLLRGSF